MRRINDAVVTLTGKLPVSRLFQRALDQAYISSNGQKYYMAVDSTYATYTAGLKPRDSTQG